jgi:hypothetical protein
MFLRPHQRSKDGKDHTYWSLVETVRTTGGPRQRTLCYLGELNGSAQARWLKSVEVFNEQGEAQQYELSKRNSRGFDQQKNATLGEGRSVPIARSQMPTSEGEEKLLASLCNVSRYCEKARAHVVVGLRAILSIHREE